MYNSVVLKNESKAQTTREKKKNEKRRNRRHRLYGPADSCIYCLKAAGEDHMALGLGAVADLDHGRPGRAALDPGGHRVATRGETQTTREG